MAFGAGRVHGFSGIPSRPAEAFGQLAMEQVTDSAVNVSEQDFDHATGFREWICRRPGLRWTDMYPPMFPRQQHRCLVNLYV